RFGEIRITEIVFVETSAREVAARIGTSQHRLDMTTLASPFIPLVFAVSEILQVFSLRFLSRLERASPCDVPLDKLPDRLAGNDLVRSVGRLVLRNPFARPCESFDLDPFNRQREQAVFFERKSVSEISHIRPRPAHSAA